MIDLISLQEAKRHLYIADADTTHDLDIALKISMVSSAIWTYLKKTEVPTSWYDYTEHIEYMDGGEIKFIDNGNMDYVEDSTSPIFNPPHDVKAAAVIALARMYSDREFAADGLIDSKLKAILSFHRNPALG